MQLNQTDTLLSIEESDSFLFIQAAYESFKRAEQKAGSIKRYYDIGGDTICLRFAGSAYIPHLTPAFEHLTTQPTATPALTICLWDCVTTETKMSRLMYDSLEAAKLQWWERFGPRREIRGFSSNRIRTHFLFGHNIFSAMDTQEKLAFYWLDDANKTPYFEKGYPLTKILNWWMENQERQCVHAAALGTPTGGVLLPGKSGSGKSTTSLACLKSELRYVSDDTSLISFEPTPYVYSLYNTAKLKSVERLPHLASLISNPEYTEEEKALFFLHKHYPEKIITGFPLRAILVPRVTGEKDTRLQPTSSIVAFKALAPSTIFQLPGPNQNTLQKISKLVKQLPCYTLELGTDMSQIPDTIFNFISRFEN